MTPAQKQYLMKLKNAKERIHKINNNLKATSGIYLFWRTDENGKHYAYIGQSVNVFKRCAEHLLGYQAIDLSIKKHGLFDPIKNKHGWYVKALVYCDNKYLDEYEKKYIRIYSSKPNVELKNITSGGQDAGRTNINEARPSKKYFDGVEYGYKKAIETVKEFFEKYLTFAPKQEFKKPKRKNDAPELKEIYVRKFKEFKELIK